MQSTDPYLHKDPRRKLEMLNAVRPVPITKGNFRGTTDRLMVSLNGLTARLWRVIDAMFAPAPGAFAALAGADYGPRLRAACISSSRSMAGCGRIRGLDALWSPDRIGGGFMRHGMIGYSAVYEVDDDGDGIDWFFPNAPGTGNVYGRAWPELRKADRAAGQTGGAAVRLVALCEIEDADS